MELNGVAPDLELFGYVILAHAVGVGAVAEDLARLGAAFQCGDVNLHVAFLPVGDGGDVPLVAFLTGDNQVFAHLAVEYDGLIPGGGHAGDELGAFVLLKVVARTVAEHVERRLEDDVFGQLAAAGALAHGFGIDGGEAVLAGVLHGALGVVQRTGHHADEGDGDFVQDQVAVVVPLGLFQAVHAFEIEHVGVGAAQSGRLVSSVEVDKQVVFGGHGCHAVIEIDHLLVVAVHEIDLETFDTQVGIVLAYKFHVLVDGGIASPKHQSHVTFLGVLHQRL